MKSDNTGRTFPPPIPGASAAGSVSVVIILVGIFLTSFIYFFALGVFSMGMESARLAMPDIFSQFSMFALLPVALIVDAYMDRRRAIMWGALMTGLGLFLMATGWLLLTIPGLVLFAIGNGMMSVSLLAYFGTQWKHKGMVAGYALAFGFAILAGFFGNWLSFLLVGERPFPLIMVTGVLMLGIFGVGYFLIKGNLLRAERGGGDKEGKELIGGLLLVLLAIISFIAIGILNFLEIGEGITVLAFVIFTLLILVAVVLGVSLSSRMQSRDKISMLLLPLVVLFFAVVQSNAAGVAWDGFESFVAANISFSMGSFQLARIFYDLLIFVVAIVIFFVGWSLRNKLKREVLSVTFLMLGMFWVALFPQILSSESMVGFAAIWQLVLAFVYVLGYAMSFGYFYTAAWMYFPVRFRGTGFAVVSTCQYLAYKWLTLGYLAQAEKGDYEHDFLSASSILMISLGLILLASGMAWVRLRKS